MAEHQRLQQDESFDLENEKEKLLQPKNDDQVALGLPNIRMKNK